MYLDPETSLISDQEYNKTQPELNHLCNLLELYISNPLQYKSAINKSTRSKANDSDIRCGKKLQKIITEKMKTPSGHKELLIGLMNSNTFNQKKTLTKGEIYSICTDIGIKLPGLRFFKHIGPLAPLGFAIAQTTIIEVIQGSVKFSKQESAALCPGADRVIRVQYQSKTYWIALRGTKILAHDHNNNSMRPNFFQERRDDELSIEPAPVKTDLENSFEFHNSYDSENIFEFHNSYDSENSFEFQNSYNSEIFNQFF